MLKDQIELLQKEFTTLKEKIKAKLQSQQTTITEKTTQLQEVNQNLELQMKENSENEKVLETLLKEFKELAEQLN
jgi:hypothetical protein